MSPLKVVGNLAPIKCGPRLHSDGTDKPKEQSLAANVELFLRNVASIFFTPHSSICFRALIAPGRRAKFALSPTSNLTAPSS